MAQVIRAQLGKHVPIVLRAREVRTDSLDGRAYQPRSVVIEHIKNPSGTAIVTNASPLMHDEGVFVYHWDTTGLAAGDYEVRVVWTVNNEGTQVPDGFIVRLVKQGAP